MVRRASTQPSIISARASLYSFGTLWARVSMKTFPSGSQPVQCTFTMDPRGGLAPEPSLSTANSSPEGARWVFCAPGGWPAEGFATPGAAPEAGAAPDGVAAAPGPPLGPPPGPEGLASFWQPGDNSAVRSRNRT